MDSFYTFIQTNPSIIRLKVNEVLIAEYQCPLSETRYDIWSEQNYFIYVISGQKKWFTRDKEVLVKQGDCLFVRKGAHSVYQYFDTEFCALVLFLPDEFIRSVLLENKIELDTDQEVKELETLFSLKADNLLAAYFNSFLSYISDKDKKPDKLLELKFRELVMVTATQDYNQNLPFYFAGLCKTGKPSISDVMEDNFYYALTLEEFAKLSGRSLSVFKNDFKEVYGTTPGKWLKKKRMNYAKYLLRHTDKPVREIVFDSGFQNTSHFTREFKNTYGCTPVHYRNTEIAAK